MLILISLSSIPIESLYEKFPYSLLAASKKKDVELGPLESKKIRLVAVPRQEVSAANRLSYWFLAGNTGLSYMGIKSG